jgi:hypothetical protein
MVKKFLGYVLPGIIRPLHTLWNEVIGFLFICLALLGIPSVIRFWRTTDFARMGITLVFVAIMAAYGILSFRRARKISRS